MDKETVDIIEKMNFSIIDVIYNVLPVGLDTTNSNNYTLGYGFLYVLNGNGIFTFADKKLTVSKGQIIHGNRDTCLKIKITSKEPFEYFLIIYSCTLPSYNNRAGNLVKSPFHFDGAIQIENTAELVSVIEFLYTHWKNQNGVEKLRLKGKFYEFLYLVLKEINCQKNRIDVNKIIGQTIEIMQQNYMDTLNLDYFAKKVDLSSGYFCHIFKSIVGVSPMDYLIQIRIEKAKVLLEKSSSSLKEIAKNVGYEDSYYFSRLFKKKVGHSPSEYKKMLNTKDNPLHK